MDWSSSVPGTNLGKMPEGMHSVHGVAGQAVDRGVNKILEWGNRGEADAYEHAVRNSMRDIDAAEAGSAPLGASPSAGGQAGAPPAAPVSLLQASAARSQGGSQGTLDARADAIADADAALGLAGAGSRSDAFMKGALEAIEEASAEGEGEADAATEAETGAETEAGAGEAAGASTQAGAAQTQLLNAVAHGEQAARAAVGDPSRDANPLEGGTQGVRMEGMPGMSEQPITIAPPQSLPMDLAATTAFAGVHAYNEDVKSLWRERSAAEDRISSLRLRVVEKVNFYESLMKRAELIKADIQVDQDSLKALQAHATAVQARIDRLKGEAAQSELSAQQHQYDMAKSKLDQEVQQMASVRDALGERVQALAKQAAESQKKETEGMRASLMVSGNGTAKATPTPAAAAAEAPPALLQEQASAGSGAGGLLLQAWRAFMG